MISQVRTNPFFLFILQSYNCLSWNCSRQFPLMQNFVVIISLFNKKYFIFSPGLYNWSNNKSCVVLTHKKNGIRSIRLFVCDQSFRAWNIYVKFGIYTFNWGYALLERESLNLIKQVMNIIEFYDNRNIDNIRKKIHQLKFLYLRLLTRSLSWRHACINSSLVTYPSLVVSKVLNIW